jgi:hypothetical protein
MSEMLFLACQEGDLVILLFNRLRRRLFLCPVEGWERRRLRRFFLLNSRFGA